MQIQPSRCKNARHLIGIHNIVHLARNMSAWISFKSRNIREQILCELLLRGITLLKLNGSRKCLRNSIVFLIISSNFILTFYVFWLDLYNHVAGYYFFISDRSRAVVNSVSCDILESKHCNNFPVETFFSAEKYGT